MLLETLEGFLRDFTHLANATFLPHAISYVSFFALLGLTFVLGSCLHTKCQSCCSNNKTLFVVEKLLNPKNKQPLKHVLFLHGFLGSHQMFSPVMNHIKTKINHLLIDHIGFGKSGYPENVTYSTDFHCEVIEEQVLTNLDSVHLVGYSMGTLIGKKLTKRNYEKIKSLTLISPVGFENSEEARNGILATPLCCFFVIFPNIAWFCCNIICTNRLFLKPLFWIVSLCTGYNFPILFEGTYHNYHSASSTMNDCLLKDSDKGKQWFQEILDLGICVNIIKTTQENSIPNSYKFLKDFEKQIHQNNGVIFEVDGDHDYLLRNPKEIALILDQIFEDPNFDQENALISSAGTQSNSEEEKSSTNEIGVQEIEETSPLLLNKEIQI